MALGVAAGLVLTGGTTTAAIAAPTERSQAEGLFLSGGGLINLDTILELAGPYTSFGIGDEVSAPIDLDVLGLIDLGLGLQLFGGNDVLTLGAVGQYSRTDQTGSFASSGLIGADGAIQVGTGAPAENTRLTLNPVLGALGVDTLISDLTLELGAVSAAAWADRGTTVDVDGDYQIAGADLTLRSAVLGDLLQGLDATLGATSSAVNGLAAPTGAINTTVNGLLGGIESILSTLLLGLASLGDPELTTSVSLDLGSALDTVAATPFISGPVTLTLSEGELVVDLEELYALNAAGPNTELLSDFGLNPTIIAALSDILTDQLPTALITALRNVLNTTELDVTLDADVLLLGLPVGTLALNIDTSVGAVVGLAGSSAPTVSLAGTSIVGLPVGDLLTPLLSFVTGTLSPAIGAVVEPVLNLNVLEDGLRDTLTGTVTALAPVLAAVTQVVSLKVNVQEADGAFRDTRGTDSGSFTQRAAQLTVAPLLSDLVTLNLASATVNAAPLSAPSALTMTPQRGPVGGGTDVILSGDGLDGLTEVLFGTEPATFSDNGDGTVTVTSPAATAPGTVGVTVTNPDGSDTSLSFEYYETAAIDTITPDDGGTAGGETVTITGVCFTGATQVLFGSTPAQSFTVDSDTQITAVVPAGPAGSVDVTIVGSVACGDATVPGGYTYVAPGAPALTGIVPAAGPASGGTPSTITGTGFTTATAVTFGGVDATEFTVINDTEIDVTTPPHAAGVVDVTVTNAAGASAPLDFEYVVGVEIDDVAPGTGPLAGGNTVTIGGACFTGATDVLFGGVSATSFTIVSDTQITAVVPAGAPGTVDVTVVGSAACGTSTLPDGYEYVDAPDVTGFTPSSGPEAGGTAVTITGTGFTGATGVTFDGEDGVDAEVVSDTEIRVTTPAGTAGAVEVVVLHPGGDVDAGDFTYLVIADVTGLAPAAGTEAGGTVVTITGTGFTGATGVTFDGEDGVDVQVVSDTEMRVTTPAHAPGAVAVVVEHPHGDAAAGDFTFLPLTGIDDVAPATGPEAGGNTVTITGTCFTGATGVLFGGQPATSYTVVSDTEIRAVVPAGTGTVDVTVIGFGACGITTLPDGYAYVEAPEVTGLTPTTGPETGGTVVTITGTGFTGATGVTFDGEDGTDVEVVSDTEIRVTTPAGTPGTVDVVVEHPYGDASAGDFEYVAVTSTEIDDVEPGEGPASGGNTIRLIGSCFTGATDVLFGGVSATSFTVVSDTEITAVAPAGTGTVDITVVGSAGCGTTTLPDGYEYVDAPEVTGLTPTTGPETGGTVVTITGTGFTGATGVTFDGEDGTDVEVVSDTEIRVTSPAGTPGTVDVVVEHPYGDANAGDFEYRPSDDGNGDGDGDGDGNGNGDGDGGNGNGDGNGDGTGDGDGSGTNRDDDELAETGGSVPVIGWTAAALLVILAGVVMSVRRRNA